jgi:hypothetical protein
LRLYAYNSDALGQSGVVIAQPGPRDLEILEKLAIENGTTLASTDQDFRRFPSLRWITPLE